MIIIETYLPFYIMLGLGMMTMDTLLNVTCLINKSHTDVMTWITATAVISHNGMSPMYLCSKYLNFLAFNIPDIEEADC